MKRLVLCLTALLLCITVGAQSLEEIRAKASTGDAYFQYLLGWSYANGANGVSLDYNAAKPWFEKASENGYAAASYFLGWMYFYGEGVTKNDTEALKWFKKSESQGMSEAHAYAMVSSNRVVDTFDPSRPPILEITANSVKFVDPNGNNAIDAGEDSYISFQVTNKGKGPASRCIASALSADNVSGLILRSVDVPEIAAGKTKTIRIPITADMNIKDGKADLVIRVNEPHGFGTDPIELAVATKKFVAPELEIVDYAITSGNVNTLKKKVPFDLQVLLQNVQHGNAEDVSVEICIPDNVIRMKLDASK